MDDGLTANDISILRDMLTEESILGHSPDNRANVAYDSLCKAEAIDYVFNRGWVLTDKGRALLTQ
jgi:hypothetical protein